MAAEKKKKKGLLIILIVLLLLVAGFGAAGYFMLIDKNKLPTTKNISLNEEILSFSIEILPEISTALLSIDYELYVIDNEIERLDKMGKEYPRQKQIIFSEKNACNATRKNLAKSLADLEKEVETIFVSYSVNMEKGLQMIEERKNDILEKTKKALEASNELTLRLASKEEKGFFDKIKDQLFN